MNLQQLQRVENVPQEKLSDMNVDNLPHQWKVVKLSNQELFAFENGLWTGKKEPFIDCPVIRNTNFTNDGSLNLSNVAIIPIEQRQLEKKRLVSGDIIIERSGGGPQQPVGRVVFFDLIEGNYCFSNFTTRLRIVDKAAVDPGYLHLYLLYFHYSGQTERLQNRTTGIRNLAFEDYKNTLIPLPPFPQQRAIVSVLQVVQAAIQARRAELKLERECKAALMNYLFTYGTGGDSVSTKKTNFGSVPVSWKLMLLEQCAFVQTGVAKGRKFSDNHTINLPYLRVANVQDGYLDLTEIKYIKLRESEVERYKLQPEDVVVTEGGDFDKLGRGFLWSGQIPNCVHQNHIFAVRVNQNLLIPKYFAYLIQSNYGKAYFLSVAHRTTNLASINSTKLKAFPAIIPSLQEQKDIIVILDACDAKITTLEQEAVLLEELFQALLEDLTTGQLSILSLVEKRETHE